MSNCPVCTFVLLSEAKRHGGRAFFECPRCGCFSMTDEVFADWPFWLREYESTRRAILSHALYQMTKRQQWALLTTGLLENILKNTQLPKPQEQLENLILWLGENQPDTGKDVREGKDTASAIAAAGAVDQGGLVFLVEQAREARLVQANILQAKPPVVAALRLTLQGWKYYDELQRGKSTSRIAFLAMKFGDAEVDAIFDNHFKLAVEATGFTLKKLNEKQPAGLIDDRLRVEIRQSRFLVADLTHHNNGAYWEAGFAEGLGKPVIYTCRKDVFEDKQQGTHFDTNHHLTVPWDPNNMAEAVDKIKATIRATLPGEAKMED